MRQLKSVICGVVLVALASGMCSASIAFYFCNVAARAQSCCCAKISMKMECCSKKKSKDCPILKSQTQLPSATLSESVNVSPILVATPVSEFVAAAAVARRFAALPTAASPPTPDLSASHALRAPPALA